LYAIIKPRCRLNIWFVSLLLAVQNKIDKAWEENMVHGYILMLYLQKGWTMREIGNMIGSTRQYVHKIVTKYNAGGRYNSKLRSYSKQDLIQMINNALNKMDADHIKYEEWNSKFAPPHGQTLIKRFGSWSQAIEEARDSNTIW